MTHPLSTSRDRIRIALFAPSAAVLAAVVVWGLTGLHDFGGYRHAYGETLNRVVPPARHVTNVVAGVTFDVRGLDTLGEEFILFAALTGTALLLREPREAGGEATEEATGEAVRLLGLGAAPFVVLLGLWLTAFGLVTPGGGFQGGVVLAAGALLLWAAGGYRAYRRASPPRLVDLGEGAGAGAFVVVGIAGLACGATFLEALLPLGTAGTLASGGTLAVLNWTTALEVAAANVLIFREFLEEWAPAVTGRTR